MFSKNIKDLIDEKKFKEAQKELIKKGFIQDYNRMFKERIWEQLSLVSKKKLFEKFSIPSQRYRLKEILKTFAIPIVPKAFMIASISCLDDDNHRILYQLADVNPYIDIQHELISYDKEQWGARRSTAIPIAAAIITLK